MRRRQPGDGGKQIADDVGQLGVGGRVGARVAADGRLVDHDGLACAGPRRPGSRPAVPPVSEATSTSSTNVLLPEPETPVTTVSRPSGMGTSMSCRLRRCAPRTVRNCGRRGARLGRRHPLAQAEIAAGGRVGLPELGGRARRTRTCPPCAPAPGPRSMARSAPAAPTRSCSTNTTGPASSRKAGSRRCHVGRVLADGRLVEHVQHVLQAAGRARPPGARAAPRRARAWAKDGPARYSPARPVAAPPAGG